MATKETFIYNKASGLNDAQFGKIETPIRMVIEHESDLLTKQGGPLEWLFNVERSNRFGETIIGGNEFDVFHATPEGGRAENDSRQDTYKKFIEHIQFMKEFTITAEMMEDANYGIAADAKRRAENFTRAYYKTRHNLASFVLAQAASGKTSASFAGASIDLTAPNNEALFGTHNYGGGKGTQSNSYSVTDAFTSEEKLEVALSEASVKFRNMKDENGDPLGYVADTIILPGNAPVMERMIKKVAGTEQASGNGSFINIQYGNWRVIALPNWQLTAGEANKFIIMSKAASDNMSGNMFFNRIPLTIDAGKDLHTGNYFWVGRCRFGIGFGSYKHIALVTDSTKA